MNYNLTGDQTPPPETRSNIIAPTSHSLSLNSSKFMEWTNDDALELIEQYRSHTELWNRADPKYKDKLCRFRAWSEIAERFGCSKAEVERKMNVLLTQYRREKHKMLVKLYQRIQPNPSKWYAFKRFDFMEAGGGTSANILVTASNIGTNSAHTLVSGSSSSSSSQAAVAAAAALNGLSTSFDPTSRTVASSNSGLNASHHRRIKSKELKYFGAMGLNLPMLLSNSRTLDSWSSAGQYSPPISSERQLPANVQNLASNSMRVLPTITAFPNLTTNPQELSIGSRSLFGGSSNNSEPTASPHKAIDLIEVDDNKTEKKAKQECISHSPNMQQENTTTTNTNNNNNNNSNAAFRSSGSASGEIEVMHHSPVINTNEAHTHPHPHTHPHTPQAHANHPPHTHTLIASRTSREPDDMEIKQELVDYFNATPLLPGTGSQRSYSSNEEIRSSVDEYAQDLRVAASKGLEFGNFVLPRNLRPARSSPTESLEEKYTPLNMRQMNATNSASAVNAAAGSMLINSILSNESTSEDNTNNSARLKRSASQDAAAAAAIYAESLTPRDDCDYVGSNVTLKLRAMDRTQRIIAEKLISEVLFYGQFNELERSARIQPK